MTGNATGDKGPAPAHVLILRQNEPYPYGWVGQEARALANAGYQVTTVTPTGFGYDSPDETSDGVRAVRFRVGPPSTGAVGYIREYASSFYAMARRVVPFVREGTVDVVIVATPPDLLVTLALPLRRRGAGVIFDQRDPGPELFEAKFGRRGPLYRLLVASERFACRHADVVMPHNEACAQLLQERSGADRSRMFVVGVGPDPSRIFPVAPDDQLRRGRRYLVLWIGTISTQEGVGRLVEAAHHLVHERGRTDITFAIVGPGDATDELRADIQRRRLADFVHVPGVVTDAAKVRTYIASADVCVSVDERNAMNDRSTMMKVLEYMAMGRAVVQFPLEEMRRLCGDTTVYARDADPIDLADKIAALLDDAPTRERLGADARRRVLYGMMWTDQAPLLVQAVRAALDTRRSASGAAQVLGRARRWSRSPMP